MAPPVMRAKPRSTLRRIEPMRSGCSRPSRNATPGEAITPTELTRVPTDVAADCVPYTMPIRSSGPMPSATIAAPRSPGT